MDEEIGFCHLKQSLINSLSVFSVELLDNNKIKIKQRIDINEKDEEKRYYNSWKNKELDNLSTSTIKLH